MRGAALSSLPVSSFFDSLVRPYYNALFQNVHACLPSSQTFVERLHWMSSQVFMELFSLGQCLPGPTSTQVSFAMGTVKKGVLGECKAPGCALFALPWSSSFVWPALCAYNKNILALGAFWWGRGDTSCTSCPGDRHYFIGLKKDSRNVPKQNAAALGRPQAVYDTQPTQLPLDSILWYCVVLVCRRPSIRCAVPIPGRHHDDSRGCWCSCMADPPACMVEGRCGRRVRSRCGAGGLSIQGIADEDVQHQGRRIGRDLNALVCALQTYTSLYLPRCMPLGGTIARAFTVHTHTNDNANANGRG